MNEQALGEDQNTIKQEVHTGSRVELLGDGHGIVLELLEQRRRDGQEVNTREGLNLASLVII